MGNVFILVKTETSPSRSENGDNVEVSVRAFSSKQDAYDEMSAEYENLCDEGPDDEITYDSAFVSDDDGNSTRWEIVETEVE